MANYLINFDLLHPAGGLELLEKEGFDILGGSVLQKDIYGTLTCEDLNQDVLDFLAKYRKSGFKYQVYKLPEGTATWHTGGGYHDQTWRVYWRSRPSLLREGVPIPQGWQSHNGIDGAEIHLPWHK